MPVGILVADILQNANPEIHRILNYSSIFSSDNENICSFHGYFIAHIEDESATEIVDL